MASTCLCTVLISKLTFSAVFYLNKARREAAVAAAAEKHEIERKVCELSFELYRIEHPDRTHTISDFLSFLWKKLSDLDETQP